MCLRGAHQAPPPLWPDAPSWRVRARLIATGKRIEVQRLAVVQAVGGPTPLLVKVRTIDGGGNTRWRESWAAIGRVLGKFGEVSPRQITNYGLHRGLPPWSSPIRCRLQDVEV